MSTSPRTPVTVPVLELFSTFQGEGPLVGERQIFLRLAKCDLRCLFCDTPESYPTPDRARIQIRPAGERDDQPENPLAVTDLLAAIRRIDDPAGLHPTLTITGGEPLLHPVPIVALAEGAHALGLRVHIETGGHRPGALRHVLPHVDLVSPDLKLETATGAPTPWDAHRESYELLHGTGKALCVKAVVGATTPLDEVHQAARFVATHLPDAPFFLQPATRYGDGPAPPKPSQLFKMHALAGREHPDVRVLPQVHKMMGVR